MQAKALVMGALAAGLLVGCGGDEVEVQSLGEASAGLTEEAPALPYICATDEVSRTRYYYSNGVECGITHYWCDGRRYSEGCVTSQFVTDYWCGCP